MARPKKLGLTYFPMDVAIFGDREIRRLMKMHGHSGYVVFNHLLCLIYEKHGYFIEFDNNLAFDIADFLNTGLTEADVNKCVHSMLELGLFDVNCYEQHKVLTSGRIQQTYINIKLTGVIVEKYRVIDRKTPINLLETPEKVHEIPQSKVKESKVKESKLYSEEQKTNFFRLKGDLVPGEPWDYLIKNFPSFVEQWVMKHDAQKKYWARAPEIFNTKYAFYEFRDNNHLQNAFKQNYGTTEINGSTQSNTGGGNNLNSGF